MSRYTQLSLEERCSIARLHEAGQSIRQIAAALDRQPSTIARELKRNTGNRVGYQPAYAQAQTSARRWTGSRLERDDDLRDAVLGRLAAGWSPEQIAGRLARDEGRKVISHETIYRFVYAAGAPKADGPEPTENARYTTGHPRSPRATSPATGRPTACSSARPVLPS